MLNFGAAYTATQESMKNQASSLAAMQGQLANIQQFCMAIGQQPPSNIYQPPSNIYALVQHQRANYNRGGRGGGRGGGQDGGGNQQLLPGMVLAERAHSKPNVRPPPSSITKLELLLFAWWQIENTHTSETCGGNPARHTTKWQPAPT